MKIVYYIILFCQFVWCFIALAQSDNTPTKQQISPFGVDRNDGRRYRNPFSGGVSTPVIACKNFDDDNFPDIFVFSKIAPIAFYKNNHDLTFQREFDNPYSKLLVNAWFRFYDLNGDNIEDVITTNQDQDVVIYYNKGTFSKPIFDIEPSILKTDKGYTIKISRALPAFGDIDNDRDLDLIFGNQDGSLTYYENIGTNLNCKFSFKNSNYFGILINFTKTKEKDNYNLNRQSNLQHGGNSTGLYDIDYDNDLDIFYSDEFSFRQYIIRNNGTADSPQYSMNSIDTAFIGKGEKVQFLGQNYQTEFADIDNDGDNDAVVSALSYSTNEHPIIYLNTGTKQNPNFIKQLTDPTDELDLGSNSIACIYADNTNIDSLRNGIFFCFTDTILHFFEFNSTNEFAISGNKKKRITVTNPYILALNAFDFNADKKDEILINTNSQLRFYRVSKDKLIPLTTQFDTTYFGEPTTSMIYDLNNDGKKDILIAKSKGGFLYFENRTSNPQNSLNFINLDLPKPFSDIGNLQDAYISCGDLNQDNLNDVVIGYSKKIDSTYYRYPLSARHFIKFLIRNNNGELIESLNYPELEVPFCPQPKPIILNKNNKTFLLIGSQIGGFVCYEILKTSGNAGDFIFKIVKLELK